MDDSNKSIISLNLTNSKQSSQLSLNKQYVKRLSMFAQEAEKQRKGSIINVNEQVTGKSCHTNQKNKVN